jgi:hypothetical protein
MRTPDYRLRRRPRASSEPACGDGCAFGARPGTYPLAASRAFRASSMILWAMCAGTSS